MPTITLALNQSITGTFQATPRGTFLDTANKLVVQQPYVAVITGGNASLVIPPSSISGVSYFFEVFQTTTVLDYYVQGGDLYASSDIDLNKLAPRWKWTVGTSPNSQWYTGQQLGTANPTTDNKLLTEVSRSKKTYLIQPFDSIVEDVNLSLADVQDLGVSDRQIEYSAYRVADLLTSNATFRGRLPKGLSLVPGGYNNATAYVKDQAVTYNGQLWAYVATNTFTNVTPGTNPAVWELAVDKPAGVISGANSVGWNRSNWLVAPFNDQAVSRQDAVGLFDSIPQPVLTNYLTLDAAQTVTGDKAFNGVATFNSRIYVPTRPLTDGDANVVNLKVLKDAIAGNGFLPPPVGWCRMSTDQTIDSASINPNTATLSYTDRPFTTNNLCNNVGDIVIPASGGGLFLVMWGLDYELRSSFDGSAARVFFRMLLNQFTAPSGEIGDITRKRVPTAGQSGVTDPTLVFSDASVYFKIMNLASATTYNTRIVISRTGTNSGSIIIKGNVFTTFLKLWRIQPIV
jgi:hypothetical protein